MSESSEIDTAEVRVDSHNASMTSVSPDAQPFRREERGSGAAEDLMVVPASAAILTFSLATNLMPPTSLELALTSPLVSGTCETVFAQSAVRKLRCARKLSCARTWHQQRAATFARRPGRMSGHKQKGIIASDCRAELQPRILVAIKRLNADAIIISLFLDAAHGLTVAQQASHKLPFRLTRAL